MWFAQQMLLLPGAKLLRAEDAVTLLTEPPSTSLTSHFAMPATAPESQHPSLGEPVMAIAAIREEAQI